jgi:hypothetical protein
MRMMLEVGPGWQGAREVDISALPSHQANVRMGVEAAGFG